MSSIELYRFRTVRHIQNKNMGFSALVPILSAPKPRKNLPGPINPDGIVNTDIGTVLGTFGWLEQVSQQCAAASDDLTPEGLTSLLPADWLTQVATASWAGLQQQLADLLAALAILVRGTAADPADYGIPVIPVPITQKIEFVARIILVLDCVTTLAADRAQPLQRRLQSADDIRLALTFRSVALPAELFSNTPPVLARAPGMTDLSVVKDEWNRYIPDQIANVINVLPGESFESGSRHLEKSVQSQSTTSVESTTVTTENSQTQSSTLSATSTSDASLNIGVHAQVETSGQYGPTTVKTNIGGQLQFSQSQSQSTARTAAQEIVARSVKTVSETITQVQTTRTTVKDTSHQQHKLQNTGPNVTVGIYRWLSVVHRVQLVNYPNRFVVEFEIPEPGAWLRWALNNQPDTPWDNPDPGPFAINRKDSRFNPSDPINPDVAVGPPLQPTDITPSIAAGLAARWMIQGLPPAPPQSLTLGNSFSIAPGTTTLVLNDNSLAVPDGYVAKTWTVDIASAGGDDNTHPSCLRVSVGGNGVTFTVQGTHTTVFLTGTQGTVQTQPLGQPTSFQPGNVAMGIPVGDINTGVIPIYVHGWFLAGGAAITLNVTISCLQSAAYLDPNGNGLPYVIWQQKTFDQISAAYSALLSAHNQERDSREQTNSGPLVVGPPQLNLTRAVAELKRLAIQNLLGQTFKGFSLLTVDIASKEPSLDPKGTAASSPVIQFFEQAFEWENIVYICYPYFWGDKTRWIVNATGASADPIFDQFLNAGSVRLVVPARPGFEQVVNFFLYTSSIWSGKNPPGPNEPGYLSVADEIQALQAGATDGTPVGDPWEITLPTTLLWAGTDPATLPKNANASIGQPPGQPGTAAASLANVAVASSSSPAAFGQSTSFSASISAVAGGAVPTGQVTFLVDGQLTADSPISLDANGKAKSAPITTLKVGAHAVIVTYLGDGNFSAATGTLRQIVKQSSSSVVLTSLANPTPRAQAISFSAAVTAVAPAAGIPTGQVSFLIDGTPTADSPLNLDAAGKATSAAVSLRRGSRTVRAEYSGDGNFATSAASLMQKVT